MKKLAIKLTHITLVLHWAYGLFLRLGKSRDRTAFDLNTIFLIPHKFLIGGFAIFSKENLMFLKWYPHVAQMVYDSPPRLIFEVALFLILSLKGLCGVWVGMKI